MNTPSHEAISQRAREIWLSRNSPEGQDSDIWLEAEKQLMAGNTDTGSQSNLAGQEAARTTSESKGAGGLAARGASTTVADHPATAPASPKADPDAEKAKETQQKKVARAPKVPAKTAPKGKPAETGKPLWDKPHSS